jgi:hypothetical protein
MRRAGLPYSVPAYFNATLGGFSRQHGIADFAPKGFVVTSRPHPRVLFLRRQPTGLNRNPITGPATLLRPRSAPAWRFRNINRIPIDFAFRLRLRGRLTLPG